MAPPEDPFELAAAAGLTLVERLGRHRVAVVAGSGWATAATALGSPAATMALADLPGGRAPAVEGHGTTVASHDVDGVAVLVFAGRSHRYEGVAVDAVVHPVRAAVLAGCEVVVLTNAAGSLRPEWPVGTPVVVADQLNLTGDNPLAGPGPFPTGRPRFCDLGDLYAARLRAGLRQRRPDLPEGVYAGVVGGSFETPAEIRALGVLGADLVGMSTVLESIAAHHLGASVLGLSLVTNPAAGLTDHIDHTAVLDAAADAAPALTAVLADAVAVAAAAG